MRNASFKQDQSRYVRTFLRKVATSYHEWKLSKWRAIPLLKVLFVIQMYLIYGLYVIIILGTSFYELCWLQWNTVGNKSVQPFPEKIWKGEWETFERRFLQNCLTKFSRYYIDQSKIKTKTQKFNTMVAPLYSKTRNSAPPFSIHKHFMILQ